MHGIKGAEYIHWVGRWNIKGCTGWNGGMELSLWFIIVGCHTKWFTSLRYKLFKIYFYDVFLPSIYCNSNVNNCNFIFVSVLLIYMYYTQIRNIKIHLLSIYRNHSNLIRLTKEVELRSNEIDCLHFII